MAECLQCQHCNSTDPVLVTLCKVPEKVADSAEEDLSISFSDNDLFQDKKTTLAAFRCRTCGQSHTLGANVDHKATPKPTIVFFYSEKVAELVEEFYKHEPE